MSASMHRKLVIPSSRSDRRQYNDTCTISAQVSPARYGLTETGGEWSKPEAPCIICGDSFSIERGLRCEASGHFHCDDCINGWIKTLNCQRTEAPDMLQARGGLFLCVELNCTSHPFKASSICSRIRDLGVLEEFLESLMHTHTLKVQEQYQEELIRQLAAVREAGMKVGDGAAVNKARKIELEALAQGLRLTMRCPKMCRQCKYGPVENPYCDDLQCHHEDVIQGSNVNNACPHCGWFSPDWSDWLPWDGNLPEGLKDGIEIAPAQRRPQRNSRPCIYFERGHCRHGLACTFMHNGVVPAFAEDDPRAVAAVVTPTPRPVLPRPARRYCAEFTRSGSCARGDECGFAHNRRRPAIPARRCIEFSMSGSCARGSDCGFAHITNRADEVGGRNRRMGRVATNQHPCLLEPGSCRFGNRCRFSHFNENTSSSENLK